MKKNIVWLISTLFSTLLLVGCYESELPIITKGEKVNIEGIYQETSKLDGSKKIVSFTEQKDGIWPLNSYSYQYIDGTNLKFKKLSSGLFLVQQNSKKTGRFDYYFADVLNNETILLLVADFLTKGDYIDNLLEKLNIEAKEISRKSITTLLLNNSNKKNIEFFNAHDKSLMMVVAKLEKKREKPSPNDISEKTSQVNKKTEVKTKEKKHPHYQLCKEAEALGGHEPYYIPFRATSNLTIRNAPSIKGKKIGLLKKGEKVEGECIKFDVLSSNISGYWIYIGGLNKHVFSHFLEPLKSEARDNSKSLKIKTDKITPKKIKKALKEKQKSNLEEGIFIKVSTNMFSTMGEIIYKLNDKEQSLDLVSGSYEWYIDGIKTDKKFCSDFLCYPTHKLLEAKEYMGNPPLSGCKMEFIKYDDLTKIFIDSRQCNK